MPDRTPLLATQESAAFSAISRYIAQTLISIQEKHPEWIAEKYRKTPWAKPDFQSVLIGKLTKSFKVASDTASLMLTAKKYLQILLVPEFINSPQFSKLFAKIQQLAESKIAPAKSPNSDSPKPHRPSNIPASYRHCHLAARCRKLATHHRNRKIPRGNLPLSHPNKSSLCQLA